MIKHVKTNEAEHDNEINDMKTNERKKMTMIQCVKISVICK